MVAREEAREMHSDPVIVIGSGLGGLAAAIRLRARGHEVIVLEAMDQPGGRAAVFKQDGFSFDAGPTVVTASYLFDELFALVGRDRRDYVDYVAEIKLFRGRGPDDFELIPPPADGEDYHVATEQPDQVLVAARDHVIDVIAEGVPITKTLATEFRVIS